MSTLCSSGSSNIEDVEGALRFALEQALEAQGERVPSVGFLFASPRHDLDRAVRQAAARLPRTSWIAASSAGELTERGLTQGGIAVMLISFGSAEHELCFASVMGEDPINLARELRPRGDPLAHHKAGRQFPVTLLFGDGLSSIFERGIVEFRRRITDDHVVAGAGAGDDGALVQTAVGIQEGASFGAAAALHVWSEVPWSVGIAHGLSVASERMTVTSATGNVVHEIDGQPAIEAYRTYARSRGVELESLNLGQFLIQNELGVMLFEDLVRVRAPLAVGSAGELICAGEVPEGAQVCIVRGEPDVILEAAREAARRARAGLGELRAAGVLVFSCVCRNMTLGDEYHREARAIADIFGDTPIVGFSSYGEVARDPGRLDGYHNNSVVVVAIPEAG